MPQYNIHDPATGKTVNVDLPRAPQSEGEILYIFSHPQNAAPESLQMPGPPQPVPAHAPAQASPGMMPELPEMPAMPAHQPPPQQPMRTAGPLNLDPQTSGMDMLRELAAQPLMNDALMTPKRPEMPPMTSPTSMMGAPSAALAGAAGSMMDAPLDLPAAGEAAIRNAGAATLQPVEQQPNLAQELVKRGADLGPLDSAAINIATDPLNLVGGGAAHGAVSGEQFMGKIAQNVATKLAHEPALMWELIAHPAPTDKGIAAVRKVADEYLKAYGIPKRAVPMIGKVDEGFGKATADAYAAMPHAPDDPKVLSAYQQLAKEVSDQFAWMVEKAGVKVEPWSGEGQPYKNSAEMIKDVRENNHLFFFESLGGFGETPEELTRANLLMTPGRSGRPVNDELRAAHDYFAHAQHGLEFGPQGEENAARAHGVMFSEPAMDALMSETRGQNSWVNFGQHIRREDGSIPRKGDADFVPLADRPYAEQKSGLMPAQFRKVAAYGPFKAMSVIAPVMLPDVDTGDEDLDRIIRIGIIASSMVIFGAAAWHQMTGTQQRARVLITGQMAVKRPLAEIRATLKAQGLDLTPAQFDRAVKFSREKLANIRKATRGQFDDIEQIKSFIDEGLRHRRCYEEGAELIAEGRKEGWLENDEDERVFAGLLGAMGANNPPKSNFRDAMQLFEAYKGGNLYMDGNRLVLPAGWNPKTIGLSNVAKVLKHEPLGGRKIETYQGALEGRAGYDEKLVADRWMARLHGFAADTRAAQGDIDEHTYEAMEQIWKQIAKDYKLSTQQAQAAGWFGIRQRSAIEAAERTGEWSKAQQGYPMLQQKRLLDAENRWIDKGYYTVKTVQDEAGVDMTVLALTPKGIDLIGGRAKQMAAALKTENGATVNVMGGTVAPKAGYVVSAFPERTLIVPKGIEVTPDHIKAFIQDNLDLLEEPDVNLGAWREAETGRVYLDLSLVLKDRRMAQAEASRRGEKAIYDTARSRVVETPQKPGLPSVGGIYDRMARLRSKVVSPEAAADVAPSSSSIPERLYHGSRSAFEDFKPSTGGEFGPGVYLTKDPGTASFYAEHVARGEAGPHVRPVRAELSNPYRVDKTDWIKMTERSTPSQVQKRLMEKGHDGIIGVGINGTDEQIVVFDPAKIKPAVSSGVGMAGAAALGASSGDEKRKYSSTQVQMPPVVASKMTALADSIPDEDLAEEGREDDHHVTVKWGLHTNDVGKVRRVLANEPPITVHLGKTSHFPNSESDSGDVVKVDVDSADLRRLNRKIAKALEHTDTHKTYSPHATVAYVKPGKGKDYDGRSDLAGHVVTIDHIVFSGKNGTRVSIPLTGKVPD